MIKNINTCRICGCSLRGRHWQATICLKARCAMKDRRIQSAKRTATRKPVSVPQDTRDRWEPTIYAMVGIHAEVRGSAGTNTTSAALDADRAANWAALTRGRVVEEVRVERAATGPDKPVTYRAGMGQFFKGAKVKKGVAK